MSPSAWREPLEAEETRETARLPEGTQVGPWRLVERRGRGMYGVVYRAVRSGRETDGPVALKLALDPNDLRFAREAELLRRLRHPGVPRLEDSGQWQHPSGAVYPYVAMEWVQGTPLYDWADRHIPSSRQAMQWFAQLARALEATHAAGGVHRDVKGGNVLVRHGDGRLVLIDFGAGWHEGAEILTTRPLPPGTPMYRAPEAWRAVVGAQEPVRYSPGPTDDLFALGVTAYRLVTGEYPPSTHPVEDEFGLWREGSVRPRSPQVIAHSCTRELDALIMKMLSVRPQDRGSARELAEALEDAARRAGPEADTPLWVWPMLARPEPVPAQVPVPVVAERPPPPGPSALGRVWLGAAAVALGVLLGRGSRWPEPSAATSAQESRDGGSAGVAEAAAEGPGDSSQASPPWQPLTREIPPKPFPGQVVPDANGRCRGAEAPINGGCWMPIKTGKKDCERFGYFEHKDECYVPMFPPPTLPVAGSKTGTP